MIFAIKNYHKNKSSNLTAISVRHFSNAPIYLFNIYGETCSHDDLDKSLFTEILDIKGKYNFGSGHGSQVNGYYFTEGINHIFNHFSSLNEKVVILDEDQYFTTGAVINELREAEYDLAWAVWRAPGGEPDDMAANILSFRPASVAHAFPLPEKMQYTEILLRENLMAKVPLERRHQIRHRYQTNYFGDGHFTNYWQEIESSLKGAGIIP